MRVAHLACRMGGPFSGYRSCQSAALSGQMRPITIVRVLHGRLQVTRHEGIKTMATRRSQTEPRL